MDVIGSCGSRGQKAGGARRADVREERRKARVAAAVVRLRRGSPSTRTVGGAMGQGPSRYARVIRKPRNLSEARPRRPIICRRGTPTAAWVLEASRFVFRLFLAAAGAARCSARAAHRAVRFPENQTSAARACSNALAARSRRASPWCGASSWMPVGRASGCGQGSEMAGKPARLAGTV